MLGPGLVAAVYVSIMGQPSPVIGGVFVAVDHPHVAGILPFASGPHSFRESVSVSLSFPPLRGDLCGDTLPHLWGRGRSVCAQFYC